MSYPASSFKNLDFAIKSKPCPKDNDSSPQSANSLPSSTYLKPTSFSVKKFSNKPVTPLLSQSSKKSLPEIPETDEQPIRIFSSKPTGVTIFSEEGGELRADPSESIFSTIPPRAASSHEPSIMSRSSKETKRRQKQKEEKSKIEGRKVDEFTGIIQMNISNSLNKFHPSRNTGHIPSLSTVSNLQPPSCKAAQYLRFTPLEEKKISLPKQETLETQYSTAKPCTNLLLGPSSARSRQSTARSQKRPKKKQSLTSADKIRREKKEEEKKKSEKAQKRTKDLMAKYKIEPTPQPLPQSNTSSRPPFIPKLELSRLKSPQNSAGGDLQQKPSSFRKQMLYIKEGMINEDLKEEEELEQEERCSSNRQNSFRRKLAQLGSSFDVNLSEIKLQDQNTLISPNNLEILQRMMSPLFSKQREIQEIEERITPKKGALRYGSGNVMKAALRPANKSELSSVSGSAPGTARSIRTAVPSARLFSKESGRQHTSTSARTVKRTPIEHRQKVQEKSQQRRQRVSMPPAPSALQIKRVDQLIRENLRKEIQKQQNETVKQALKIQQQIQRLQNQRKRNADVRKRNAKLAGSVSARQGRRSPFVTAFYQFEENPEEELKKFTEQVQMLEASVPRPQEGLSLDDLEISLEPIVRKGSPTTYNPSVAQAMLQPILDLRKDRMQSSRRSTSPPNPDRMAERGFNPQQGSGSPKHENIVINIAELRKHEKRLGKQNPLSSVYVKKEEPPIKRKIISASPRDKKLSSAQKEMLAGIVPPFRKESQEVFRPVMNFRSDSTVVTGVQGNALNNSPLKESVHEFKRKQEKKRRDEKRKEQDQALRKKEKLVSSLANLQHFYHKKKAPKTPQKSSKKARKQKPELIIKQTLPQFYLH